MAINTSILAVPLLARTATVTGVDLPSNGLGGCHFVIVVTENAAAGSITPKVQNKDAAGNYYDVLVGTAITSTGTTVLKIGRGMTPVANNVATDQLSELFRVVVTHNNANQITYSGCVNMMV
jgi:hypothetical protein